MSVSSFRDKRITVYNYLVAQLLVPTFVEDWNVMYIDTMYIYD